MPITNPFGDDSDESDDGFTNPFASKKAVPAPAAAVSSSNNGPPKAKAKANTSTNPFGGDNADIPKEPPTLQKKSLHNNPFGDNDDNNAARKNKNGDTTGGNVSFLSSTITPSSNDSKSKNDTFGFQSTATNTSMMNPFSQDHDNRDFGAASPAAPPAPGLNVVPRSSDPPVPIPLVTNANAILSARKNKSKPIPLQGRGRSKTTSGITVDQLESMGDGRRGGGGASGNMLEFADFPVAGSGPGAVETSKKTGPGLGIVKKGIFGRRKVEDANNVRSDELSPIVSNMDQEHDQHQNQHRKTNSVAFSNGTKKKTTAKPGSLSLHSRSKSDASALNKGNNGGGTGGNNNGSSTAFTSVPNEPSIAGWLMRNKVADDKGGQHSPKKNRGKSRLGGSAVSSPSRKKASTKKKKNVFVQCWPYDDYHRDQEKYYESMQEKEGKIISPGMRGKDNTTTVGYNSDSDEDNSNSKRRGKMGGGGGFENESVFDRPSDLPSIKQAVQNLSLLDFENKAEQRAISIVSKWLFDEGLIDELLVNGANGGGGLRYPSSSSAYSISVGSVKSSEGVEVGAHGFPIEGGLKIDKEIDKLRARTRRDLTLINTRLNDGVAASGAEVQELVNAVSATKSELGRLRELATYISTGYKEDGAMTKKNSKEGLQLADYPRLKRAINARRNIFKCFGELEFFAQIPLNCDKLREELHHGEWTANEWNTIRNVCMEHVQLEILLVEAEAGMKAWLDDDNAGDDDSSLPSLRSNKSLKKSWLGRQSAFLAGNHQVVDNFLSQHVKNVWELGDEIRMRILSGVGSAFDLALQNPAGMVALVEAVEVYERAAEQYNASRGDDDDFTNDKTRLRFTNMRTAALSQLYQDFELRGLEVFRAIHMQAADLAEEEDALNSQFTAVLRAATELVTEIDVVKNQMAPCFAPHWHVEVLWSSCVAHVCSNQIIQQIGGPDGQNLPDLTVTQLLDLVAWVEFFRETIEDAFPSVGSMHAKKAYFDERPDLFAGDDKAVNMENATDSLAWVNNMLWEVHRLAQDEFLMRTREQTDEWITRVYDTTHETTQTREGRLVTTLCEDIFTVAGVQLRTIRERLSKKSDALVMAVCLIFSQLRAKQLSSRDRYLKDLETCCAAANDFQRMSEQVEDVVQDLIDQSDLPSGSVKMMEDSCGALVSLYSGDSVFAAQRAHSFIFEPIWNAISDDLFGPKWEVELTHNELIMTLTRTLDDFMGSLETYLDEFMLKKTVDALVAATVVFYVKCLLLKSETHNNNKVPYFADTAKALERMDRDVKIMREYFDDLAKGMPALSKVVEKEFSVLLTLQELMRLAANLSESDASDFILFFHKRVKDINITKHVVGDLWHLVQPTEERKVWELTESLEDFLLAVCPPETSKIAGDRMNVPGLRLDETLAKLCIESTRKRPVLAGVLEKMASTMKSNWASPEGEH
mmetsp:Transcript_28130/g.43095  ORF Transcript_28130/g.43095 Transcript_28130/m.43095 type:complete len:1438 (+) Transcript_28130:36-4349(+)